MKCQSTNDETVGFSSEIYLIAWSTFDNFHEKGKKAKKFYGTNLGPFGRLSNEFIISEFIFLWRFILNNKCIHGFNVPIKKKIEHRVKCLGCWKKVAFNLDKKY